MALYRYSTPSLIDEITVLRNSSGGKRALLHARSDASPEQLKEITHRLAGMGYKAVPISENGKPLLEVRGFPEQEVLLSYIATHGWTLGNPKVVPLATDKISRAERIKKLTLRMAGISYMAGDVGYMSYATKDLKNAKNTLAEFEASGVTNPETLKALKNGVVGEKSNIAAGIGYAAGSVALAAFGSKDQSNNEIKAASRKVKNFAYREGLALDDGDTLRTNTQPEKKTTGQKILGFANRYPSEILNTIYIGVGGLLMSRSVKKIASLRAQGKSYKHDITDIGLGLVTLLSALTGLVVKEKKRDPDEPKRTGFGGFIDWIQEKPLRATGYGLMISTFFHAIATVGKYREGDKLTRETVTGRGVFVIANIFSEIMLAISSKGHGEGVQSDESNSKTVIAMAAETIAKQTPDLQEGLINRMAGYMASPEVLGGKAETIAAELRAQLAVMHSNPWAHKVAVAAAPAPVQPEVKAADAEPKTTVAADSVALAARKPLPPVEAAVSV